MPTNATTFRSILVPLDGSSTAERAVPLAIAVAQRTRSKIRLALVHQTLIAPVYSGTERLYTSIELSVRKSEKEYLRGWTDQIRERSGRPVTAVTLTGSIAPALEEYVRNTSVDLVVMTTHGRGLLRRAWLGSVADHMVRSLEIPVLLVRSTEAQPAETPTAQLGNILVPLDGSPLAEAALEPAMALARACDVEIDLVQVIEPLVFPTDSQMLPAVGYDEKLTMIRRDAANDYLNDIAERVRADGIKASSAAVLGVTVAEALLELAGPERYGIIAIATHGRGGLRRLALGSVADKLIRAADIPVLVCHPSGSRKRPSGRARSVSSAQTRRPGKIVV
ncbi:MAG TPA: universal stress protein [Gemmatimonadales bacterium]|jgi:nucleotide-binding universal stress UspA family protein